MTLEDQIRDAQMTEAAERIRCSALVLELEKTWKRRIGWLSRYPTFEPYAARADELKRCLRNLRAERRKLQNDPSSASPAEKGASNAD